MLSRHLFAFTLLVNRTTYRKMSTSFHLDRSLFNQTLYDHVLNFWFHKLPQGNKSGTEETMKQWWGAGRSKEEGEAIDEQCRKEYSAALESIAPEKLELLVFESYEEDLKNAKEIARPFLEDIESADGDKSQADRLLAITLLLDQVTRNIYRSPSGLRLVYTHYDRLAWSLIRSSPSSLLNHSSFRGSLAHKQWLCLPLMHAEDLESQNMSLEYTQQCQDEASQDGDQATVEMVEKSKGFAKSHRDIVERFGRFPHRNECLGRENRGEEGEWLKTGETFGVKQGQDKE